MKQHTFVIILIYCINIISFVIGYSLLIHDVATVLPEIVQKTTPLLLAVIMWGLDRYLVRGTVSEKLHNTLSDLYAIGVIYILSIPAYDAITSHINIFWIWFGAITGIWFTVRMYFYAPYRHVLFDKTLLTKKQRITLIIISFTPIAPIFIPIAFNFPIMMFQNYRQRLK